MHSAPLWCVVLGPSYSMNTYPPPPSPSLVLPNRLAATVASIAFGLQQHNSD